LLAVASRQGFFHARLPSAEICGGEGGRLGGARLDPPPPYRVPTGEGGGEEEGAAERESGAEEQWGGGQGRRPVLGEEGVRRGGRGAGSSSTV